MSKSSIANLSFGIAFEEGFKFPWSDISKYDDGINDWWLEITGYIEPNNYSYEKEKEWLELHPIPIEIVHYCACDYHMDIIATRCYSVEWGETLNITLEQFAVNIEQDTRIIVDFLNKYNIQYEGSPAWILSSFYG